MFRLIDIWTFSHMSTRWLQYRGFFTPLISAVFIGSACGILVVSKHVQWQELWQQRGQGLRYILVVIISSFIALFTVYAVIILILIISSDYARFNGSIAEMVVHLSCFGLVGLPVFGFLYSYFIVWVRPNLSKQKYKPRRVLRRE